MKNFLLKHKYGLILLIPGIIGGYLYWKFIGCTSGSCAIKSNWYSMIIFGSAVGYLIGDMIDSYLNKKKSKKEDGKL
ncbi:MAG: hypothetical protein PF487_11575 [Bacteroidales bacterium]|nr:hypothetical protein [Bacteroidales bacterium]